MTSRDNALEARAMALAEEALALPEDQRAQAIIDKAGNDHALRDRALALLEGAADEDDVNPIPTGGGLELLTDHLQPEFIGRYRILGELGRGGMGAVYKGERNSGDFEHTAAIKVIRARGMSSSLVERFTLERQTLARMAHPNIARLYDGGTLEDGAPYIVMEYIDGAPIMDWMRDNGLDAGTRLKLFLSICDAVAYAHQNQIVHRDITPSNVLITRAGDVKLIDFGIAKPYSDAVDATNAPDSLASLSFTPGYAAPERARGVAANTLSDIYSLGKLLTTMLADAGKSEELDAICEKAASTSPEDRYSSVDALSEDIKRYASGAAVQAFNGGSAYHIGKFVNRNRLAVSFSMLAAVGLIAGLILTTTLYREADAANREAQARFNDVRQLANTMMFDIYDAIENVPGASEAEVMLAEAAQQYLDDLSTERSDETELQLETARGFTRLAKIQGSPTFGAQNKIADAKANYASAEQLLAPLSENEAAPTSVILALHDLYYNQADMALFTDHNTDAALVTISKDVTLLERELERQPEDKDLQLAHIAALSMKSLALARNLENEESLKVARLVRTRVNALAADFPDGKAIQRRAAISLNNVGRQLINMDLFSEAIPTYSEALAIVEELYAAEPDNETYIRDMAYTYWRRAHAHSRNNDGHASLKDFQDAYSYISILTESDPANRNHQSFAYVIKGESMLAYAKIEDYEKAEDIGRQYVTDSLAFAETYPDDKNAVRDAMIAYQNLISLYTQWPAPDKLCTILDQLNTHIGAMKAQGILSERDAAGMESYEAEKERCGLMTPR